MRNKTPPIKIPQGIISVYSEIQGPQTKQTIKMAVDTGASITMIPPEKIIATGHKIPTSQDKMMRIFTASGIEYIPIVKIKTLSCLGISIVLCHSLPSESPVEGLLGLNFLAHIPAFIDFYQKITSIL